MSVSYEGRRIAAAGTNAGADESSYVRVFEWNVDACQLDARGRRRRRDGPLGSNGGIALSGDGKRLAVGDANGTRSYVYRVSLERDVPARGIGSATTSSTMTSSVRTAPRTFGYAVSLSRNGYEAGRRVAPGGPRLHPGLSVGRREGVVVADGSRYPRTSDNTHPGLGFIIRRDPRRFRTRRGRAVSPSTETRLAVAVPGAGIARAYEWDRVSNVGGRRWAAI